MPNGCVNDEHKAWLRSEDLSSQTAKAAISGMMVNAKSDLFATSAKLSHRSTCLHHRRGFVQPRWSTDVASSKILAIDHLSVLVPTHSGNPSGLRLDNG